MLPSKLYESSSSWKRHWHSVIRLIASSTNRDFIPNGRKEFKRFSSMPIKYYASEIWNHQRVLHPYLNRVTHKSRTHLRSLRRSLPLQKIQWKYNTKISLTPQLIELHFKAWFHDDIGCFLPLFYHILHKQGRFPPFNETLNGPRNHNTQPQNEAHGL